MKITEQKLAKLLKEAQQAHHKYEQTLDETDDDWAKWYATYIHRQLKD
jgi:hypothetical protein